MSCEETMESTAVPAHTHTCNDHHSADGDHFCQDCGRWWWQRPETHR